MTAIGIDISKAKFDIAVQQQGKWRNKVFPNSAAGHAALLDWLEAKGLALQDCHFCMEATGSYYEALAIFLHAAGRELSVVNPLRIKAFAQAQLTRQKTDRADARVIAQFCAQHTPARWQPPAPEVRELQRLLARLEAVQGMQVQERNRRHEAQGLAQESVSRLLAVLAEEQRWLEEQMEAHIARHPPLQAQRELLQTIPAVGVKLSAYWLAWLPMARLTDVRQAVAFIGLSPRRRESGSPVRGKAVLCKLGHARLRKLLYLPAMSALRCNPAAQALAKRLKAAGKPGKLILGAIMRKLVHWMFGVLKSNRPFDPQLALAR